MTVGSIARLAPRRRSRLGATASVLAAGALAGVVALPLARAAYRPPFEAQRYVVAADNTEASRAAAEVLHAGGNAADGAVAAALALGVTGPAWSGFGGGGFATICSPQGQCTFVDFRETAPAGLTADMFRNAPDPAHASTTSGLAVGVPGEPAGLLLLSRRFGHVPLARAAAPAIALARRGFVVTPALTQRTGNVRTDLAHDPLLSRLFLPAGTPVAAGTRVRRPLLATTLARYAREGERFIRGPLASAVAAAVRARGGVMTEDDVRRYVARERAPLARAFRGYTIVTAPPPSAGGIILLEALAAIEAAPPAQLLPGSSAFDHLLADAFRGAFDDRARYVGDPGDGPSMADALLDPARLARRRAGFDPNRVRPVVVVEPANDHGTTHVCVMDASGMTVSLTTTVNLEYGSRIDVPGMDVVLNNEIDDFSLGTAGNNWSLAAARPNALVPGRRPVSSMTPTVVLRDGRPVGCVGASGGPRIATATTQVLLNMLLHGMDPEAAVSAPRIHHQGMPDQLLVEPEVAEDVRIDLRARGYTVVESPQPLAISQAIRVHESGQRRVLQAASDPRKGGLPAGE